MGFLLGRRDSPSTDRRPNQRSQWGNPLRDRPLEQYFIQVYLGVIWPLGEVKTTCDIERKSTTGPDLSGAANDGWHTIHIKIPGIASSTTI